MKKIKLTQGQYAIVDDVDFDWLNQYKWSAWKDSSGDFYAIRMSPRINNKRFTIRMSREILGLKQGDKRQADHRNHNTLDNRRRYLRVCTRQQNQMNRKSNRNSSSRFKGVSWYIRCGKWMAYISINKKRKYLGYFKTEKEAALAYNRAAKKHFRAFACLNFSGGDL